jgi:tripartite-type tricarboxylate transporter receptor subunit TctC
MLEMAKGLRALWIGVCLAASAVVLSGQTVIAQDWPSRPIRIIVPFAPGGAVDIVARILQDEMGKNLGTTMLVENRGGGAGVPAAEALVRSAPDGYTISLISSNHLTNGVLVPNLSYDVINDVTPISMVVINTVLILVPQDSPIKTLADLVKEAKAKPGALSYASAGSGTAMNFAGELLKSRAGINLVHVPYRGAGPALNDLLGNQVPVAIIGIGPAMPFIEAGKVRPLAITTEKRSKNLPNIPTVDEAGYPGYRFGEWFALIGPKGLPPEITNKIHAAFIRAINTASIREKIEKIGLDPTSSSPEELKTFMATEVERIRQIANEAKMIEKPN